MSSTTKKTPIDKKSQEYLDSLETTEQLFRNLSDYERMCREENDQKKRMIAEEIASMGEHYVEEINNKHKQKEEERLDMIDYIIETTKEKLVKAYDLKQMTYEEVKSIYVKAQDSKKSWFTLLIEFIMG